MPDYRVKENISLYRKGFALASTREGGHITGDYEIAEDSVAGDGTRTIVLKPRDKAEFLRQIDELVDIIAEGLGESESRTFKALLRDTLIDYHDEDVSRMLNKLKGQKAPVKAREGCFKIIIGDGRRKNAEIIDLK